MSHSSCKGKKLAWGCSKGSSRVFRHGKDVEAQELQTRSSRSSSTHQALQLFLVNWAHWSRFGYGCDARFRFRPEVGAGSYKGERMTRTYVRVRGGEPGGCPVIRFDLVHGWASAGSELFGGSRRRAGAERLGGCERVPGKVWHCLPIQFYPAGTDTVTQMATRSTSLYWRACEKSKMNVSPESSLAMEGQSKPGR